MCQVEGVVAQSNKNPSKQQHFKLVVVRKDDQPGATLFKSHVLQVQKLQVDSILLVSHSSGLDCWTSGEGVILSPWTRLATHLIWVQPREGDVEEESGRRSESGQRDSVDM
jgi:hypothetical protein